ncbi:MAG: hypothetical protein IJZ96_09920 [Lachnospiraceae bacterium]|nr:hypothetical protein [Lachnospiraceae bacterium]
MDLKNKYRYARAFIVLLAALITLILNIKYERDTVRGLIILLVVIIAFYIISSIAIKLIDKIRTLDTKVEKVEGEEEENQEESSNEG